MEQVQQIIEQIGPTRLIVFVGLAIAVGIGVKLWKSSGSGVPSGGPATGLARCTCGWSGNASVHRPRCPRCGKTPQMA